MPICSNFALTVHLPIYLFIVENMFYSHVYTLIEFRFRFVDVGEGRN